MKTKISKSNRLLFLIAAALFSTQARADGATQSGFDPSSDLVRSNYFPHAHQFLIEPDYRFSINDSTSATATETEISYQEVDINILYGIVDRLWFTVLEQDLFARNNTLYNQSTGNLTSATLAEGFSDPTLGLSYRLLERVFPSKRSAFGATANLSVSPSWLGGKAGTTDNNGSYEIGSNGKGYVTASLSSTFYWIVHLNDFSVTSSLFHRFPGSVASLDSSGNAYLLEPQAASEWQFIINDRIHLWDDSVYINLAAFVYAAYALETTNPTNSGGSRTLHSPLYVMPSISLGWRPLPHFVFDLSYQYYNETSSIDTFGGATSESRTIDGNGVFRLRFEI